MKSRILWFLILVILSFTAFGRSLVVLTEPFANSLVNLSGIPLTMELCLWNLRDYQGTAQLVYENEEIRFSCDMKDPVFVDPTKWVWAYPEVYYGYKPWSKRGVSQELLPLPEKVKKLPEFELEIEYSVSTPKWLSMNMSLDIWLTRRKYPTSVENGDVEIMIWPYRNMLKPAGDKLEEFPLWIKVNGERELVVWEIWYDKMEWDYVAFRSKKSMNNQKITLPIREFLKKTKEILLKNSDNPNPLDELYVEDLEFGSEFGSPFIPKAILKWSLKSFRIFVER